MNVLRRGFVRGAVRGAVAVIVVDADVIASFWIKSARTDVALQARRRDADWIVPLLWRSELRSVLRQHLVRGTLGFADAVWIAEKAEAVMEGREYAVRSADVLKLVERTVIRATTASTWRWPRPRASGS